MTGRVLMIQGTSSSVGKSLLVAALCRIFARQGVRVAPFKAQNMSNNSAVCADGGEIGRAQALQAAAAGIAPTVDMNPILLKPEADVRSQVIVNGRRWQTLEAREYFRNKQALWPAVCGAIDRLRDDFELVVIEGAGSPAEMNLCDVEIVNMSVARYCQAPVLLVGDIERGGVFAQLLGTLWLLSDSDRSLVRGLLVNKFHGDVSLFNEGRTFLEQHGGVPVLGVIPWISGLNLPEEDAEALTTNHTHSVGFSPHQPDAKQDSEVLTNHTVPSDRECLDIAVIRLPRISNFDDFDPIAVEPRVGLRYVDSVSQLGHPHVIILPGTKSTMCDLEWLRETGLAMQITELVRKGTHVVGICGGYQMLGQSLRDPEQVESTVVEMHGLGLLPTLTVFTSRKETCQVSGVILDDRHCPGERGRVVEGYEIHMGRTSGGKPWLSVTRSDIQAPSVKCGAMSDEGAVWGCYLHGLFANDAFRRSWLSFVSQKFRMDFSTCEQSCGTSRIQRFADNLDQSLNRLADRVEAALDRNRLEQIVWNQKGTS